MKTLDVSLRITQDAGRYRVETDGGAASAPTLWEALTKMAQVLEGRLTAATPAPPAVRPQLPEPEIYTPERIAEFLLSNATTVADYHLALAEVRNMGLDPAHIPHCKPAGA